MYEGDELVVRHVFPDEDMLRAHAAADASLRAALAGRPWRGITFGIRVYRT